MGVRSAIYIYNGRILLVRVEVHRLHHSPVEVGFAVVCLDRTAAVLRHVVALPWVLGCEVSRTLAVFGVHDGNLARHGWSRVVIIDKLSVLAQGSVVPSLAAIVHHGTFAALGIHHEDVTLDRRALVGCDDDALALAVEAEHFHHLPFAGSQLLDFERFRVARHTAAVLAQGAEIEVVVAILAALHDEAVAVPRQELDRVARLHILLVGLAIQLAGLLAGLCAVGSEATVVLVAVQLKHIDGLAVRAPCDVGEVAVCRVASLQIDGLACHAVEYAHGYLVRCLACHRILVWCRLGAAGLSLRVIEVINLRNIHLWIICHHALVHAIEGEQFAVRAPEGSLADTELIAVNTLSIYDRAAAVCRDLEIVRLLLSGYGIVGYIEGAHIEVAALQIGECILLCVSFEEVFAIFKLHLAQQLMLLEVDGVGLAAIAYHHDALSCKRELSVVEGSYLDVLGRSNPLVDIVDAEELGFLSGSLVYEIACLGVLMDEFVSPPGTPAVLCHHIAVVVATEVQIFQCEGFLALLRRNHALSLYLGCIHSHHGNHSSER